MITYVINDKCVFCDSCISVCPAEAIKKGYPLYYIDQEKCQQCGECAQVCGFGAIDTIEKD
jgi:ferredoxin